MGAAIRTSWKTLPLPLKREPLGFSAVYANADAARLKLGLIPRVMEDKWFIFFEDGWLFFHRSWTGACIYAVQLDVSTSGVRVRDSWVNRVPDQYKGKDTEYDRKLVGFLIDAFLLGKKAKFPLPADVVQQVPGVYQHHLVGKGYPEIAHVPAHRGRTWLDRLRGFLSRKKNN